MQNLQELLNKTKKKTLLVIYPHPDDETMASGGLLLAAKAAGFKTVVITLTRGGAGRININPHGKSLKELRSEELTKATKILKVSEVVIGDFNDGQLRQTQDQWVPWVKSLISKYKPGIVVTYDHSGVSGHPDHISLSLTVEELLPKNIVLLWSTWPKEIAQKFMNPQLKETVTEPTYKLDLKSNWFIKWRAVKTHGSQIFDMGVRIPLFFIFAWKHYEWYHEVDLSKNYPHKFIEFKI